MDRTDTTTRSRPQRRSRRWLIDSLVSRLMEGTATVGALMADLGLDARDLADLARDPEVIETARCLARLEDMRAQSILCRHRAAASERLASIAMTGKPGDATRRACLDVLNTNLDAFPEGAAALSPPGVGPPGPAERRIQAHLERLGRCAS